MVRRGSVPEMKATRKGAAEILRLHVPHEGMAAGAITHPWAFHEEAVETIGDSSDVNQGNIMANDAVAVADFAGVASTRPAVSPAEWEARVQLAALYRLVALQGWDDLIFTHISARVPGPEHHFLINPFGAFYEEITASLLVKIDLNGKVIGHSSVPINAAGFNIHSAIHASREDAQFVLHLHSDHGVAVAAQAEGLLPLTQNALRVLPFLAYHDYEGIALSVDERVRLVADIGTKTLVLLRNHGTLSVGQSAAEAWLGIYFLERACRQQVMALSAGRAGVLLASDTAQQTSHEQAVKLFPRFAERAWPGLLRLLDRRSPGYDT